MSVDVQSSEDRQVETWWLDEPSTRNAITFEMWEALRDHAERVQRDEHVRVVVIRGRGGNFSSGADITGLGRTLAGDRGGSQYRSTNAAAEAAIAALPLPTVAAVEGFCIGGGVQLALACDLRVAHRLSQWAITPAKLGIAYPAISLRRLVAIVGVGAANELLLTGTTVAADVAHSMGLVSHVVDDVDGAIEKLVGTLLVRSPFTQAATKAVIGHLIDQVDVTDVGRRLEQWSLEHGDLAEGLLAFKEKRDPQFGNRPTFPVRD